MSKEKNQDNKMINKHNNNINNDKFVNHVLDN